MIRLRRRDSLRVVDEEVLDHVLQTVRRVALGQVDGDDVGVDVHTLHATVVEEATRQLVDRTNALRGITRAVALVPHAGEAPVQLEAHHARPRGRRLGDRDGLAHGGEEDSP